MVAASQNTMALAKIYNYSNSVGGMAAISALEKEFVDAFNELKWPSEVLLDLSTVQDEETFEVLNGITQDAWCTKSNVCRRLYQDFEKTEITYWMYGGDHVVVCLQNLVRSTLESIPDETLKRFAIGGDGRIKHPGIKSDIRTSLLYLLLHERRHGAQDGRVEFELETLRYLWNAKWRSINEEEYFFFGHEADAEAFAMAASGNPDLIDQVATWERKALPLLE